MKINSLILVGIGLVFLAIPGLGSEFIIKKSARQDKVVALTFDDGPHPETTDEILTILKTHRVKATFFMIGQNVDRWPDKLKSVLADGHQIGNHSYDHQDYSTISVEAAKTDIAKSQWAFYRAAKIFPVYFRPPYGRISKSQIPVLDEFYYKIIKWSIDSRDWEAHRTQEDILNIIETNLEPGAIIICHDGNKKTVALLPDLIKMIQNHGYDLVTISELGHL